MSTKSTRTFIRVKLRSRAGGISIKDVPIEGMKSNEEVVELQLMQTEEVESLLQKVVIGEQVNSELRVVG